MTKLIDRLTKYVSFETTSNPYSETCPSSPGQTVLATELLAELKGMGLDGAYKDENSYVYAKLEGNKNYPAIGFVAHMDTSPDMYGKCDSPKVFEYKGGDIELNEDYSIKEEEFPFIKELVGQTLMTTSGDSLLGADNKAGIAIVMEMLDYFIANPQIERGDICVCFTPDEEIGRGADLFDVASFGADFAYTIDGGPIGELEYESFNAASADIIIRGKNVHPGTAKGIMINSQLIAMELESLLPKDQKPEYTSGYEGFFLLTNLSGNVEETKMEYIIRDFSKELFADKKQLITDVVEFLNKKYEDRIELVLRDSYYNMREKIEERMEIVELAKKAYIECGVVPDIKPIRGGTDGSKLSYMGLLTPNIFTGGYNYHGRYEFISIDQMTKSYEIIKTIIINNAK